MTQREKFLALIVGGLGGFLLLVWLYTWIDNGLEQKRQKLANLQSTATDQELEISAGMQAADRGRDYAARSLPPDPQVAATLYKAWLQNLVEKELKLTSPSVTAGRISAKRDSERKEIYSSLEFTLKARGTLEEMTRLMHEFYLVDYLHQVRVLNVVRVPDTRQLDFTLNIEAVSLPAAAATKKLTLPQDSELAEAGIESLQGPILHRNLFGPANRPPELSRVSKQEVEQGDSLSLSLKASDPDELDDIRFELGDDPPEAAKLSDSGRLGFRSDELGTYEFTVRAVDDGLPPLHDEQTILVTVVEPPPPMMRVVDNTPKVEPPRFEDGKFAFVTGITEINGRRQLWLNVRDKGEMLRLHEGDDFRISRLKATVTTIDEKAVEITSAGETRRFRLRDNLSEGEKVATQ